MTEELKKYNITEDQLVWFDAEDFEEIEAYEDTFANLVAISQLDFTAISWQSGYSTINDSFLERPHYLAMVTFFYNNSKYTIKLSCYEWFDEHLITTLNQIIKPFTNHQFVIINTGDQSLAIAFVSPQQQQQLAQDQMIEDEYETIYPDNWNELMF